MKKVIRAAVMALAVILLAASCSKTTSNTLALPGGGHRTFRIEETHLTRMVLSEIEGNTVYRHTFKYMSVK